MDKTEFSKFIERTSLFQEEVGKTIAELSPVANARFIVAFQSGQLAFEHSIAALQLIKSGLLPSGYSLFRPQFESLVRGIWLLHAASDSWVDKLSQPLTVESANKANEGPNLTDMLVHLEKSEAPTHLVSDLKEFKLVTWKILNSYIHGGLHPISRTMAGYPFELTFNALRNSNAITALTTQLIAILSGNPENMIPVRVLHTKFDDCLPIIKS